MGVSPPSKSYAPCGRSANANDADPPPALVCLSSNPEGSDGAHGGLTGVVRCTLTPSPVCFPAGVQMESHPHLSLKWEKDGATSSRQQRQPLPANTGERKEGCRISYEESEGSFLLFRKNVKNKINKEKKIKTFISFTIFIADHGHKDTPWRNHGDIVKLVRTEKSIRIPLRLELSFYRQSHYQ